MMSLWGLPGVELPHTVRDQRESAVVLWGHIPVYFRCNSARTHTYESTVADLKHVTFFYNNSTHECKIDYLETVYFILFYLKHLLSWYTTSRPTCFSLSRLALVFTRIQSQTLSFTMTSNGSHILSTSVVVIIVIVATQYGLYRGYCPSSCVTCVIVVVAVGVNIMFSAHILLSEIRKLHVFIPDVMSDEKFKTEAKCISGSRGL